MISIPSKSNLIDIPIFDTITSRGIELSKHSILVELDRSVNKIPNGCGWTYFQEPKLIRSTAPSSTSMKVVGGMRGVNELEKLGRPVYLLSQENISDYCLPVICSQSMSKELPKASCVVGILIDNNIFSSSQFNELYEQLIAARNRNCKKLHPKRLSFIPTQEQTEELDALVSRLHRAAQLVGVLTGKSTVETNYKIATNLDDSKEIAGLKLGRIGFSPTWEEYMFPPLEVSFIELYGYTSAISTNDPVHGSLALDYREADGIHISDGSKHPLTIKITEKFGDDVKLSWEKSLLCHMNQGESSQSLILRLKEGLFEEVKPFIEGQLEYMKRNFKQKRGLKDKRASSSYF